MASIEAMQADPNVDIVLLQEALPREGGLRPRGKIHRHADEYATRAREAGSFRCRPRTATPTTAARCAPRRRTSRSCRKPTRRCAPSASASIATNWAAGARGAGAEPHGGAEAGVLRVHAAAKAGAAALDEAQSKEVLRAYGITTPAEHLTRTPVEAVKAADEIGYPVVLKAVSAKLLHKTDAGAVALNLTNANAVRGAYDRIAQNAKSTGVEDAHVCWCAGRSAAGSNFALGASRSRNGPDRDGGSGGVLLELAKDVAFCAPPVTRDKARHVLSVPRGAAHARLPGQRSARRRRGRRCADRARAHRHGFGRHRAIDRYQLFVACRRAAGALEALNVLWENKVPADALQTGSMGEMRWLIRRHTQNGPSSSSSGSTSPASRGWSSTGRTSAIASTKRW